MQAIELAQPRFIAIEDRGRKYTIAVAPIAKEKWMTYFAAIVNTSEYQQGKRVDSYDSSSARRDLAESVIVDAGGYTSSSPLTEIENWQSKLPLSHLITVGNVLTSVGASSLVDDEAVKLGEEPVYLDAVWGADEKGVMRKLHNLRHTFRTPSGEQHRRFNREASRSVVTGGSRTGKTRWLGAQAILAELYDELVVGVDGYTLNGAPLTGKSSIVAAMDTYHKAAAAEALFTPAEVNVIDSEFAAAEEQ
jgi:hypothetical protein